MNIETLLNNILEVIYKNPNKMSIEYSNLDGKESLIVNGEEMLNTTFDDSEIKDKITRYKTILESLDSCVFVEALEALEDEIDFKEMDELINQESFNKEEAALVEYLINKVNSSIINKLTEKISEMKAVIKNVNLI